MSTSTILFRMHFHTPFGKSIAVIGGHQRLGDWEPRVFNKMLWVGDGWWELSVPIERPVTIEYKFALVNTEYPSTSIVEWENGANRHLTVDSDSRIVIVQATWKGKSELADVESTDLFKQLFWRAHPMKPSSFGSGMEERDVRFHFEVTATCVPADRAVYLVLLLPDKSDLSRNRKVEKKSVVMSDAAWPLWTADVLINQNNIPCEYYYEIPTTRVHSVSKSKLAESLPLRCPGRGVFVEESIREIGHARQIGLEVFLMQSRSASSSNETVVYRDDGLFKFSNDRRFLGSGIQVPVFSLRTKRSLGVGEFLDLKECADLCVNLGIHLIQLLPINDTAIRLGKIKDSYPYSPLSVCALNPLFVNVDRLNPPDNVLDEMKEYRKYLEEGLESGKTIDVEYEKVYRLKMNWMRRIFDSVGHLDLNSKDFDAFLNDSEWLRGYTLYSAIRDSKLTAHFDDWGEYETITAERIRILTTSTESPFLETARFYMWVQYMAHLQLTEACQHAKSVRVTLKGDLPIGVNVDSVDCWQFPQYFDRTFSVGAPPDQFSKIGQNWGFPTYDWEALQRDDFVWFKMRLRHMAKYFQAYRIDHILGFFRIWEMYRETQGMQTGMLGRFRPSMPFHESEFPGIDIPHVSEVATRSERIHQAFKDAKPTSLHHLVDKYDIFNQYFIEHPAFSGEFFFKEHCWNATLLENQIDRNMPDDPATAKQIKLCLLDVMSDRSLVRDPLDVSKYHPRYACNETSSYALLDMQTKAHLEGAMINYFHKRHNQMWNESAWRKLPAIKAATNMLICAEDLGLVPDCVRPTLHELSMLTLRVQRFTPPDASESPYFDDPSLYPHLCVGIPSSHDCSPLRLWWKECLETISTRHDKEANALNTKMWQMWQGQLHQLGTLPAEYSPFVCDLLLSQQMWSPAMWIISPLQDLFGMMPELCTRAPEKEWINDPSNPDNEWIYRIQFNLEDLANKTSFVATIRSLMSGSGRCPARLYGRSTCD